MRGLICKSAAAIVAVAVATSPALAGGKIHPLEGLNPVDYGFNTNFNVQAWFRGYEFTVQGDNVVATEIGLRTPAAGQQVTLQLWRNSTMTLVASTTTVLTPGNVWEYHSITPVPLINGERYTVGIHSPGTNAAYYFRNGLPSEWYPTGMIKYETMRFHNSADVQFPTSTLAGYHYGVVDIGYVIPAPGALALLGLGAAVGTRRRRRA